MWIPHCLLSCSYTLKIMKNVNLCKGAPPLLKMLSVISPWSHDCLSDNRELCSPINMRRGQVTGAAGCSGGKHHWPQNAIKIYPFNTIITASLNSYHTTLQLIVHFMLDVGAHTLPCLLCWLPHLLSHRIGRSRTMGFCCFSLKGLMRVVLLSMMGIKQRKQAPCWK